VHRFGFLVHDMESETKIYIFGKSGSKIFLGKFVAIQNKHFTNTSQEEFQRKNGILKK
jgi:hypothetical protein